MALLLLARVASAQQAAVTAEALFRAGREASRRGDPATACERYRDSYRLDPATGTLLNLAVCSAELGALAEAWRRFHDVIHSLSRDDRRVALAKRHLRALEPRLPRLTIARASSGPEDLQVALDGIELGAAGLGVALPVDPGSHVVRVSAPGREARDYVLEVQEGDRIALEVEPGAELAAEPKPEPSPEAVPNALAPARAAALHPARATTLPRDGPHDAETSPDLRELVAYGLLGVGAASLIAGVAASALVLDRLDTVDEHCPDMRCDSEGLAAVDSGSAFYTAMVASFGLAVLASASGAYLLLSKPDAGDGASLRVAAVVAPGAVGGTLRTTF